MTELQQLIAMLTRAGIGHGRRHDWPTEGTAVQVEESDEYGPCDPPMVTEFLFDKDGRLVSTGCYEHEPG